MKIQLDALRSPVLDLRPDVFVRDPALVVHDGRLLCFHTAVRRTGGRFLLSVDLAETDSLRTFSTPRQLATGPLNFSSPGNAIRVDGRWGLCVQSYPIPPGEIYGSEASRLWRIESTDLLTWSDPIVLHADGCTAAWARSRRQIDPYLVRHDGRYFCFYKTDGKLGLMVSQDLAHWEEACADRPVLSAEDTPDGATVENPCVVRDGDQYVLFFAPCRKGRGIGVARSDDLIHWRDVRYLDFPALAWSTGGPTAAMVADLREQSGVWLMAFHGEVSGVPHGAAMGVAVSDDLEHWRCP